MRLKALAALALLLLAPVPAHAFRLVPIEMEFEPSGRGATQIFRLENENRDPVAVEVKVMARAQDPDGQDVLTEAGDDWVVFPEQVILEPGQNQSVRVQWVGNAAPPVELAYRLIAEQLPVDIGKAPPQGGQVRLLVRYVASLYVMPQGVRPSVGIVSAGKAADGRLELVVRNSGTSRQILREPTLTLQGGGKTVTLAADQLEGLAGENLLAGTTRRFLLPWPAGLAAGSVTASLKVP